MLVCPLTSNIRRLFRSPGSVQARDSAVGHGVQNSSGILIRIIGKAKYRPNRRFQTRPLRLTVSAIFAFDIGFDISHGSVVCDLKFVPFCFLNLFFKRSLQRLDRSRQFRNQLRQRCNGGRTPYQISRDLRSRGPCLISASAGPPIELADLLNLRPQLIKGIASITQPLCELIQRPCIPASHIVNAESQFTHALQVLIMHSTSRTSTIILNRREHRRLWE